MTRHTSATPAGVPRSRAITGKEWRAIVGATFGYTGAGRRTIPQDGPLNIRYCRSRDIVDDVSEDLAAAGLKTHNLVMRRNEHLFRVIEDLIDGHRLSKMSVIALKKEYSPRQGPASHTMVHPNQKRLAARSRIAAVLWKVRRGRRARGYLMNEAYG